MAFVNLRKKCFGQTIQDGRTKLHLKMSKSRAMIKTRKKKLDKQSDYIL